MILIIKLLLKMRSYISKMEISYCRVQPNHLTSRTAIEAKSAVLHQNPYLLVQFLIISFAYAKLIRLKSPPSVAERNCKNKIEQSACQSCLRKKLSLSEIPTDRTFENRHVGCKEREKINRRRTLCTLRINFFEVTPQTACIFSKEILPVKSSLNPYRTYLV